MELPVSRLSGLSTEMLSASDSDHVVKFERSAHGSESAAGVREGWG